MARRVIQSKVSSKYKCKDCKHSYDWHEKNWQGELFMCRCPYHTDGKYIKFLKDPQCERFELRRDG